MTDTEPEGWISFALFVVAVGLWILGVVVFVRAVASYRRGGDSALPSILQAYVRMLRSRVGSRIVWVLVAVPWLIVLAATILLIVSGAADEVR